MNCVLRNKKRQHNAHRPTHVCTYTHSWEGTPGRMVWHKFLPVPTPSPPPHIHTFVTRTSTSPTSHPCRHFFPENLTGPLSKALLARWDDPEDGRQDMLPARRTSALCSEESLCCPQHRVPEELLRATPLLRILSFSSGCFPRCTLGFFTLL